MAFWKELWQELVRSDKLEPDPEVDPNAECPTEMLIALGAVANPNPLCWFDLKLANDWLEERLEVLVFEVEAAHGSAEGMTYRIHNPVHVFEWFICDLLDEFKSNRQRRFNSHKQLLVDTVYHHSGFIFEMTWRKLLRLYDREPEWFAYTVPDLPTRYAI